MIIALFEQTFLMMPLVLGIYLSYSILKITDLTVDGSFVLGAAIYARLLTLDYGHGIAMLLAILGGMLAGVCVSLIQRHNRIKPLVASIIMLFMLYSIQYQIMGKPNINLLHYDLFSNIEDEGSASLLKMGALGILNIVILSSLYLLLSSHKGLVLRAFGHQPKLLKNINRSAENQRLFGLTLSNGLASCCGAITAQVNGFADINMGFGMALTGIGAVVIGQQLFTALPSCTTFSPARGLAAGTSGLLLYFLLMHLLLYMNINPINLKLFLGLILILSLRSAQQRGGQIHAA